MKTLKVAVPESKADFFELLLTKLDIIFVDIEKEQNSLKELQDSLQKMNDIKLDEKKLSPEYITDPVKRFQEITRIANNIYQRRED